MLERLEEIEAHIGAPGGSRTVDRSELGRRSPSTFDVSASLDALDRIELPTETLAAHNGPVADVSATVSPDQVFASFF